MAAEGEEVGMGKKYKARNLHGNCKRRIKLLQKHSEKKNPGGKADGKQGENKREEKLCRMGEKTNGNEE